MKFDEKIRDKYIEYDSLINVSALDMGSKQILSNALFNSTLDKFRRMGSTLQGWMYDKMNHDLQKDCRFTLNTNMSDFYLNFTTGKHFQKITYLDLHKAYHRTDEISCPEQLREIQRACLLKMFFNGNKLNDTKALLDSYVVQHNDSAFYSLMEERFLISDPTLNGRSMKSSYVNIHDQEYNYDDLIKESSGNIVLVDFWASWCGPCRKGMPDIKRIEQKYEDENFKVIYISIDQHPSKWKKAARDEAIWDRNNFWAYNFHDSEIYNRFNLTHIPRYIIYDKSGAIAYQKAPKPDAVEDIIVDLLRK